MRRLVPPEYQHVTTAKFWGGVALSMIGAVVLGGLVIGGAILGLVYISQALS